VSHAAAPARLLHKIVPDYFRTTGNCPGCRHRPAAARRV